MQAKNLAHPVAHFWVEQGQTAYTGTMSIGQQVPVELGYLGPSKECRKIFNLQVSKPLGSIESVEGSDKFFVRGLFQF